MLNRAEDRQLGPMQKRELVEVEGEIAMAEKNPISTLSMITSPCKPCLSLGYHFILHLLWQQSSSLHLFAYFYIQTALQYCLLTCAVSLSVLCKIINIIWN